MSQLLFNTIEPEILSLDFNEIVLGMASAGELPRSLFIVPTARMRGELERVLTTEHMSRTGLPAERLPIHTFGSFAHTIYTSLAPPVREITPELQAAMMERAMREVSLEYFARGGDPSPGVVEQLTRVINGLRMDGILPSDFERDIAAARENEDDPRYARYDIAKLTDLYNVYGRYVALLGDRWIDYPGTILRVDTALFNDPPGTFRGAFPDVTRIYIHGFSEFTQPELVALQQLGRVDDLSVTISFDYAEENGPLYGNFSDTIRKLLVTGYRHIEIDPMERGIPETRRRPYSHHMRRNLFRTDERIENDSFDEAITVYGFFNREEEVQGIAALIKWLVVERGVLAERIAVTTHDMGRYAELFREHLSCHGIPARVTSQFALDQSSLVTAIFSALNVVSNGYDRRYVLRAVNSPYLGFGADVDAAALVEASTQLRITFGTHWWTRRIEQRLEFLRSRRPTLADEDEQRMVDRETETLEAADRSIRRVIGTLETLDRKMTPGEFRRAMRALIARLGVAENILRLRHDLESRPRTPQDWQRVHDEVERDTRALAEFLGVIDELMEFMELEYGVDGEGAVRPLQFYIDHLRVACSRSLYRIREKHDYGVLVAPVDQLRGLELDVVIVCGLIDGEFPSTYVPESFIGKPLPDAEERKLRRERIEFYEAITRFRDRLYLTWPRFAGDRELVRSPFLDALLRITTVETGGRVVMLDELRVVRERLRREAITTEHLDFISALATHESLSEEAGRAIWQGESLPYIDAAADMLANLHHTARVEIDRFAAKAQEDESLARPYRGIIAEALSEEERELLAARRGNEYSASQLELYARCPFKYFAYRVLGVSAPTSYDVSLTPLERGSLLHIVLFRLYKELRESGALPLERTDRERTLGRAREIAREEIAGIILDHPYWRIDQERMLGGEAFGGLLEQWIDEDIRRSEEESALEPRFFEASFGEGAVRGAAADPELAKIGELAINDVLFRGKVDRVEIYHRGDEILFAVADYKTGQPPSRRDLLDGLSLQLMVYLEVVRRLLATHFELPLEQVKPVGGIYYRLNARDVTTDSTYLFVPNEVKGKLSEGGVIDKRSSRYDPDTIERLQELVDEAFGRSEGYVEGIASGMFHVTPHDVNRVCRDCDYQSVCRVSEVKVPTRS